MPETIDWDEAQESMVEQYGPNAYRAIRSGTIHGIPLATGDTPDDFLFKAVRILAANGAAYNNAHPRNAQTFLNRIRVYGATTDAAAFRLFYEPFQSNVNSVLQVSSSHRKALIITDRIPGTGAMLRVSLDIEGEPNVIPEDLLKVGVVRSQRVISVYKVNVGTLPLSSIEGDNEIIDCVNHDVWCGRQRGAWRLDDESTSVSRYGGYWTQQLSAIAAGRKDEVWDVVGVMQSATTGKYAMSKTIQELIAADVAKPYKFGIISTPSSQETTYTVPGTDIVVTFGGKFTNGFIRAGMYPVTNFASIFGFGANGSPFGGNL